MKDAKYYIHTIDGQSRSLVEWAKFFKQNNYSEEYADAQLLTLSGVSVNAITKALSLYY